MSTPAQVNHSDEEPGLKELYEFVDQILFARAGVAGWASSKLNPPVEIKPYYSGQFARGWLVFSALFLAFFILGPPVIIVIQTVVEGLQNQWTYAQTRALGCLGIWIIVGLAIMSAIFVLPAIGTRRHLVKFLDSSGVTTRGGHHYAWPKFKYLEYQGEHWARRGVAGATRGFMFRGFKRISIRLVFDGGIAIIPPLIKRQDEILALMETMPAERREV